MLPAPAALPPGSSSLVGGPPQLPRRQAAALLAAAFCGGLQPAAAAPDRLAAAESEVPLSEIVVTARKIEETAGDVPMSLQVLTSSWLEDADLTRLYELQFSVPGLVVNNLGMFGGGLSLRGVSNQGGTGPSVAAHLDGVYLGVAGLALARLFDLERIEVLKGPQGTLYGRNATGGSINYVTRSPGDQRSAAIEAARGSFSTTRLSGHVNYPTASARYRLAFVGSSGDGYIRNSVDERRFAAEDYWGVRASVGVEPTDALSLELMLQRGRDTGASGELWTPNPAFLADPDHIRLTTVTLVDPFLVTEHDAAVLNVDYELSFATLQAVSGYASHYVAGRDDCAGIPPLQGCVRGLDPATYRQVSQEIRLAGESGKTDWLFGVNIHDADETSNFFFLRPLLSPRPVNDSTSRAGETAYAAFGQARFRPAERWRITAGARQSYEEREVTDTGTGSADHAAPETAGDDWSHTSWLAGIEFLFTEQAMGYASVSTGFKSGGITTTILPGGEFNRYDPERLTAWEIGWKAAWPARQSTANLAIFFYDFRDLQITSVYLHGERAIAEVENAARAELWGFDGSAAVSISDRLALSFAAVWTPQREFVNFESRRTGDALSGRKLARAPELSASAAIDASWPLSGNGQLSARLEYGYRSSLFFTADNDPLFGHEGFGLVNMLLRFEPAEGNWQLFASGRNLARQDYFHQVFLQSAPGYPDSYEVGFGVRF